MKDGKAENLKLLPRNVTALSAVQDATVSTDSPGALLTVNPELRDMPFTL